MATRTDYEPSLISWNLTRACNLRCPHCYLEAGRKAENELTTAECLGLIDEMNTSSMSDSSIVWKPRMDEPSKPIPSSKSSSERSLLLRQSAEVRSGNLPHLSIRQKPNRRVVENSYA